MGFARRFGSWFSMQIVFILTWFYFVPIANFKLMQAIIISFQSLVPSFTYWDLVLPVFVGYFLISFLAIFSWRKK